MLSWLGLIYKILNKFIVFWWFDANRPCNLFLNNPIIQIEILFAWSTVDVNTSPIRDSSREILLLIESRTFRIIWVSTYDSGIIAAR